MLCPTTGDEAELVPPTPNRPPDRASGSAFLYMASARFPSRFGSQKLETAAERRRSDLKRDEGHFCARRTHSVQTGRLVTNTRLDLAFGLQYWAMVLQTGTLWGRFRRVGRVVGADG